MLCLCFHAYARFRYYRGADGILLVYDTTDRESFEHVDSWLQEVNKYANDNTVKVLIGNKVDKDRVVSTEEGRKKAESLGLSFIETSAKASDHVEEAFALMSRQLVRIREQQTSTLPVSSPVVGLHASSSAAMDKISTCCSG